MIKGCDMELEISTLLFLLTVAFVAGFVDSIAGGGGILTIPALLSVGIPPTFALGTNKLQASFGSCAATFYYARRGMVSFRLLPILLVFCASGVGSLCVQFVGNALLAKIVPFLLIAFGLYFLFSPKISARENAAQRYGWLVLTLGCIGFYDGFFGPGTGSFFLLALLVLGAYNMIGALAHAKLYNFCTNLASILFFALLGNVLWSVGFVMAIGQFVGGYLGSKVAFTYGTRIIKPLIVSISLLASLKLLIEQYL